MADEEDVGVSIRHQIQAERMQKIREVNRVPRVRVLPRDDEVRKHIKHYPSQVGFPAEGSVEWPYDSFTKKRIRDGAVTIDQETGEQRDARRAQTEAAPEAAPEVAPARATREPETPKS
jgi:hypothetical protein